jgi:hypothetical protein
MELLIADNLINILFPSSKREKKNIIEKAGSSLGYLLKYTLK